MKTKLSFLFCLYSSTNESSCLLSSLSLILVNLEIILSPPFDYLIMKTKQICSVTKIFPIKQTNIFFY